MIVATRVPETVEMALTCHSGSSSVVPMTGDAANPSLRSRALLHPVWSPAPKWCSICRYLSCPRAQSCATVRLPIRL